MQLGFNAAANAASIPLKLWQSSKCRRCTNYR